MAESTVHSYSIQAKTGMGFLPLKSECVKSLAALHFLTAPLHPPFSPPGNALIPIPIRSLSPLSPRISLFLAKTNEMKEKHSFSSCMQVREYSGSV